MLEVVSAAVAAAPLQHPSRRVLQAGYPKALQLFLDKWRSVCISVSVCVFVSVCISVSVCVFVSVCASAFLSVFARPCLCVHMATQLRLQVLSVIFALKCARLCVACRQILDHFSTDYSPDLLRTEQRQLRET